MSFSEINVGPVTLISTVIALYRNWVTLLARAKLQDLLTGALAICVAGFFFGSKILRYRRSSLLNQPIGHLTIMDDDDVTTWLHHQLDRQTPTLNPNRWSNESDVFNNTVVSHIVPNPPERSKRSGIKQKKAVSQEKTSLPQSKGKKAVSTASTATAASGPSNRQHSVAPLVSSHAPSANLLQDSDDKNARIRNKKKKPKGALELKDKVHDDVGLYFGEPTCGEED
ncbi:uncharacterized protein MELLADRAFT_92236 [Melampsora larici-populina 98AG31]|uniref:Uncharacterized protein n=1 Tax=Melampsora larici-populina (strain 98AG31 / pathotype 3-4-7) TaxID=747676 RepID=F4R8X2_MELLP|nr:uncharacterized protein MELLADRAFT_92236 [Melampsora larici-populina 98AG31]EGG10884.1 hypothetical protein MELLADRAFT_92236 [Melampsora larici-populina 98AG31]